VGVDIEPTQLDFARGHLERAGVEATLQKGDALVLPFEEESFEHVWMMWLLEHIADAPAALREARRVLDSGGVITAIEVDYSTCRVEPSTPAMEALFRAMVQGMAASGWSDAGTRLPGWLREVGFTQVDEGERTYWWQNEDLAGQARYAARRLGERTRRARATAWRFRGGAACRAGRPACPPESLRRGPRLGHAQVNGCALGRSCRRYY
jgi:SAM-dependent methyltransferase